MIGGAPTGGGRPTVSFQYLRRGSPIHSVKHYFLEFGRLETLTIMAQQKDENLAIPVGPGPTQREGAARHGHGLPLRSPGMGPVFRRTRQENVIAFPTPGS